MGALVDSQVHLQLAQFPHVSSSGSLLVGFPIEPAYWEYSILRGVVVYLELCAMGQVFGIHGELGRRKAELRMLCFVLTPPRLCAPRLLPLGVSDDLAVQI